MELFATTIAITALVISIVALANAGESKDNRDTTAILSKRIASCGFKARIRNAFHRSGIRIVLDLVTIPEERELYRISGLGEKSVREIMDFLKKNNLELGMKIK
jgi:DNA-directed RNA polymerase alpha subunit